MRFSRQEYWSGLPFPSPGDLPDPGIEPRSPALQADSFYSIVIFKAGLVDSDGKESMGSQRVRHDWATFTIIKHVLLCLYHDDNTLYTDLASSVLSVPWRGVYMWVPFSCSTRASPGYISLPQANFKSLVARDVYIHSAKESLRY